MVCIYNSIRLFFFILLLVDRPAFELWSPTGSRAIATETEDERNAIMFELQEVIDKLQTAIQETNDKIQSGWTVYTSPELESQDPYVCVSLYRNFFF